MLDRQRKFTQLFNSHLKVLCVEPPQLFFTSTAGEALKLREELNSSQIPVFISRDADEETIRHEAFRSSFLYGRRSLAGHHLRGLEVTGGLIAEYDHALRTLDDNLLLTIKKVIEDNYANYLSTPLALLPEEGIGAVIAYTAIIRHRMGAADLKRLSFLLARQNFLSESELRGTTLKYRKLVEENEMKGPRMAYRVHQDGPAVLLEGKQDQVSAHDLRSLLEAKPVLQALVFVNHAGNELEKDPQYLRKMVESIKNDK